MLQEFEVKKIVKKWQPYFSSEEAVTSFYVSTHGIFITLINESYRPNYPDSLEGFEIAYSFNK